ncbi:MULTISPECIES: hypothetical protein [Ehrlichia]|uniref:Uncharacterized protein n=1 Tax=Ehrlichia cf. muris str. EmCRT TaxID=1359167 RepID=A0A0F3NED0_9RICK|nr:MULTISPECIES: hypothetical protein [Ehrlichia]KJV66047.1 hypothetical protein EMUCRT_0238 [Ehrlichia cf. muris str. EmCRT]OUC04872.1 hypothetical protein DB91_00850 [Ehrlichia sp. Wisconsin_h]
MLDKDGNAFLSDADLYKNENGRFVTDDLFLKYLIYDPENDLCIGSGNHNPYLYGAKFDQYCIVKAKKCLNEIVILQGTNQQLNKVYLGMSLAKNEFKSFLVRMENTSLLYMNSKNYLDGGLVEDHTLRELFYGLKTHVRFISEVHKEKVYTHLNFFNEANKMFDTMYCVGKLSSVDVTGLKSIQLL